MISVHSQHVADFDRYYLDLGKRNDSRNPWLEEFRNYRLNCTMKSAHDLPSCTGKSSNLRNTNFTNFFFYRKGSHIEAFEAWYGDNEIEY